MRERDDVQGVNDKQTKSKDKQKRNAKQEEKNERVKKRINGADKRIRSGRKSVRKRDKNGVSASSGVPFFFQWVSPLVLFIPLTHTARE
jgi:hypothetical protein